MTLDDYHNTPVSKHEVVGSRPTAGLCPHCGRVSGSFRIGVQLWHYCDPHGVAWHTSSSRQVGVAAEDEWAENRQRIASYVIVMPTPCSLARLLNEEMIASGEMRRE